MPLRPSCECPLCELEPQLWAGLAIRGNVLLPELLSLGFTSPLSLLEALRMSNVDEQSDQVLSGLLRLRAADPDFVESLFVLAFVPMLHRTIRRVALYQPFLAEEDITQEALACLLQVLCSEEMQARKSHYAFAVSRAVKRQIFEWGRHEGLNHMRLDEVQEAPLLLAAEDNFERNAELRHFLYRCVQRGALTDNELDLLMQFKLEGTARKSLLSLNGHSSNAVRQKMKRLLAKLKRLAR